MPSPCMSIEVIRWQSSTTPGGWDELFENGRCCGRRVRYMPGCLAEISDQVSLYGGSSSRTKNATIA
jgi:hypothetical protein